MTQVVVDSVSAGVLCSSSPAEITLFPAVSDCDTIKAVPLGSLACRSGTARIRSSCYGDAYPNESGHPTYQERAPSPLGGKDGRADPASAYSLGARFARGIRPALRGNGRQWNPYPLEPETLARMLFGTL